MPRCQDSQRFPLACGLSSLVLMRVNTPEKVVGARCRGRCRFGTGTVLYDLDRNYRTSIESSKESVFISNKLGTGTIKSEFGGIELPFYTLQVLYEFVLFP